MHHFMGSLPKWLLTTQKETSSCVLNMTIFKKFFGAFMRHIIRLNAGKEIKSFSELFINKIFEYTFVTFEYEQTILKIWKAWWKLLNVMTIISTYGLLVNYSGYFRWMQSLARNSSFPFLLFKLYNHATAPYSLTEFNWISVFANLAQYSFASE